MLMTLFRKHVFSLSVSGNIVPESYLVVVRIDGLDRSVRIVLQLREFYTTLVIYTAGQGAVMVEEIPFILKLNDGVMCCPSDNGI